MDDNYNKLGDFFKNKMDDFDGSEWERPDADIRQNVLNKITEPTAVGMKGTMANAKIFLGAMAAMLLFSFLSIGYLFFENKELNQKIQLKNLQYEEEKLKSEKAIASLEERTIELKKKIESSIQERKIWKQEQEILSNNKNDILNQYQNIKSKYKKEVDQNEQYVLEIKKQKERVNILTSERNQLTQNINEYISLLETKKETENIDNKQTPSIKNTNEQYGNLMPLGNHLLATNSKLFPKRPIIEKIKKSEIVSPHFKYKRNKFDIGYEYSTQKFEWLVDRSFEKELESSKNISKSDKYIHLQGVNLGYSPHKNWWLRIGIKYGKFDVEQFQYLSWVYDDENEEERPDGEIYNQFNMGIESPYLETSRDVGIKISDDLELGEEDILDMRIYEKQKLSLLQIPLGVEYAFGKNKWQWLIQGGAQWNRLSFLENEFDAVVAVRGEEIEIWEDEEDERLDKEIPVFNYAGIYAGLGVDYELFKNIHIRGALNYKYDFINTYDNKFSNSAKIGTVFKLGLNYRF